MSVQVENHVLDLLPAFVLGGLTDDETNMVAQHLVSCHTCQAELVRLQSVAEDLPLALVQTSPPARVKENLMRSIHSRRSTLVPVQSLTAWQKLAGFLRQPLPALGFTLVLLLVVGNLLLLRQFVLSPGNSGTSMRVIALANTQDAPEAVGTLILDPKGLYGTLVVDNLAPLSASQQYQIWLIKGGVRTSGGVFSVNTDGYASHEILVSQPLIQYDSIGITIEPFGGSPGPTGARVLGSTIPH